MTIELIDGSVRAGLAVAAFLSILMAFGLWQRGARTPVTLLLCLAGVTGGVLAVEALVALTVRLAAPRTAEFNEFRWVLLARDLA
ncbi:MAG: hypothetical protein K8M05_26685, partial [Deltaproteobacteria bacterium]|nr:hypothetical protein [Kofleriaceae bacterium]